MQAQRRLPDLQTGNEHDLYGEANAELPPMAPPPFPTSLAQEGLELPPISSPAHELQAQLKSAFEAPIEDEERWPFRNTMAALVFGCGLFWGGVIWGLTQIFA